MLREECGNLGSRGWRSEDTNMVQAFFYEMEGFEKWRVSGVTRGGEIVFVNTVYFSDDKLCVLYYDPKRNSIRYVDFEGIYSKERRRHNSVLIWTLPDHVENTMRLY